MTVAIVINSCEAYYRKSCPRLLRSLSRCGIAARDVHLVVGESSGDKDESKTEGVLEGYPISVHYRRYANIDNNGLIWASELHEWLEEAAWLFYMHDTCEVDEGFGAAVARLASAETAADAIKLHGPFSMSMGFYRISALRTTRMRSFLSNLANYDASAGRLLAMKRDLHRLEDVVFRELGNCAVLPNVYSVEAGAEEVYSEVRRRVEVWAVPGLRKFKANWGQSLSDMCMSL